MSVPTCGKSRPVEPGRVVEVVAVGHAVEVGGGAQALGGCSGLVAGMIFGSRLVGAGVVGGAAEAAGHYQ